jgi:hypothetical protein
VIRGEKAMQEEGYLKKDSNILDTSSIVGDNIAIKTRKEFLSNQGS